MSRRLMLPTKAALFWGMALAALLQTACSSDTASALNTVENPGAFLDLSSSADENDESIVANNGPEGDSNITVDDRRYPLDSALADIWGHEDNRYNVNFTLTNGNFTLESAEIDGELHNLLVPAEASAVLYAEMYYPGMGFNFAEFQHAQGGDQTGSLPERPFFINAYVSFDVNGSGSVEQHERFDVIGGGISFNGMLPDLELSFSVLLETGQVATGHYTGLFDFTQR